MKKSPVWDILKKDKYTPNGIHDMEQLYNYLEGFVKLDGQAFARTMYKNFNECPDETLHILDVLTKSEKL